MKLMNSQESIEMSWQINKLEWQDKLDEDQIASLCVKVNQKRKFVKDKFHFWARDIVNKNSFLQQMTHKLKF